MVKRLVLTPTKMTNNLLPLRDSNSADVMARRGNIPGGSGQHQKTGRPSEEGRCILQFLLLFFLIIIRQTAWTINELISMFILRTPEDEPGTKKSALFPTPYAIKDGDKSSGNVSNSGAASLQKTLFYNVHVARSSGAAGSSEEQSRPNVPSDYVVPPVITIGGNIGRVYNNHASVPLQPFISNAPQTLPVQHLHQLPDDAPNSNRLSSTASSSNFSSANPNLNFMSCPVPSTMRQIITRTTAENQELNLRPDVNKIQAIASTGTSQSYAPPQVIAAELTKTSSTRLLCSETFSLLKISFVDASSIGLVVANLDLDVQLSAESRHLIPRVAVILQVDPGEYGLALGLYRGDIFVQKSGNEYTPIGVNQFQEMMSSTIRPFQLFVRRHATTSLGDMVVEFRGEGKREVHLCTMAAYKEEVRIVSAAKRA